MIDLHSRLRLLKRPVLLTRAARYATDDYRRIRDLPRLTGQTGPVGPAQALIELLEIEGGLEMARQAQDASYTFARHIEVLAAIMCEARDLEAMRPQQVASLPRTAPLS